jgi:hypothetical protein
MREFAGNLETKNKSEVNDLAFESKDSPGIMDQSEK